jgi:trk system potassium uptake protein TrkA
MEELLYQKEIHTVFSAGNGEVEVYELASPAAWRGRALRDLLPESGCVAVALSRAGKASLPGGDTRLEACDVLDVSATWEGIEALRKRLSRPEEA